MPKTDYSELAHKQLMDTMPPDVPEQPTPEPKHEAEKIRDAWKHLNSGAER